MTDCPICLCDISSADCYTTPCNHTFCKNCILKLFEKLSNSCPLCRAKLENFNPMWNSMSVEEFYNLYKQSLSTKKSQCLVITEELLQIIKFLLTNSDKKFLDYLLSDNSKEQDFKITYDDFFVKKKRNFINIQDFYKDFTLSLLFYSYH